MPREISGSSEFASLIVGFIVTVAIVCMRRGPYHQRGNAPGSTKIDDEATRLPGLGIKPDEGFDHAVFLGFHHMERFFEIIKGKGVGRQWRRVDATRLQKPQ